MEPVTLATVTAGLTVLGTECAKGVASQAGKEIWSKVKGLFGWRQEPNLSELPHNVATRLQSDEALVGQIIRLLQDVNQDDASLQMIGSLVSNLAAEKVVVVAGNVEGGINF
ncbi:MAG: hypothetical protein HY914_19115 [Desulfomonile tiedjei]|nr:hypothetical protein [Desulfomonile tiedjei]